MNLEIQPARVEQAVDIGYVKQAVWPEESVDLAGIQDIIRSPQHNTLVAVLDGAVAGFVDSFSTRSAAGVSRWEIDLLAVHPASQGRGIGSRLVAESVRNSQAVSASVSRALIKVGNTPSERAFIRCGFAPDSQTATLLVASDGIVENGSEEVACSGWLFPVQTINYRGLWLETEFTFDNLIVSKALRARQGVDLVGAVIPDDQLDGQANALAAGFTVVGQYRWWWLSLGQDSGRQ